MTPRSRIFLIKVGTWIISYAFSKSMKTPSTCSLPFRLLLILSCIRIIWSTVLLFFRNPAWFFVISSLLSRNHWNLFVTILSMVLHREDVSAIGLWFRWVFSRFYEGSHDGMLPVLW